LYGIRTFRSGTAFVEPWERIAYGAMLLGTGAVGFGSTWYHLHPDNARLFWDRLPMTVVFMSLAATTVGERVSMKAGKLWLLPLILLGLSAVLYWRFSGDLRLYAVVQFGSMLALPVLLAVYPPRYSGAGWMWWTVILYVLAKVMELLDREMASVVATGGHPWKHLAAAAAVFVYAQAVARRRPLADVARALAQGAPPAGSRFVSTRFVTVTRCRTKSVPRSEDAAGRSACATSYPQGVSQ